MQPWFVCMCVCMCMCVCVYVCMHVCVYVYMCVCVRLLHSNHDSYRCIIKVLGQVFQCPVCKTSLPVQNPIHPNFSCEHLLGWWWQSRDVHMTPLVISVHDIVTKYRQQSVTSQGTQKVSFARGIFVCWPLV